MKRVFSVLLSLLILFSPAFQTKVYAAFSDFEYSDSYRAGVYYDNLLSVSLTGNLGEDIAAIALCVVAGFMLEAGTPGGTVLMVMCEGQDEVFESIKATILA